MVVRPGLRGQSLALAVRSARDCLRIRELAGSARRTAIHATPALEHSLIVAPEPRAKVQRTEQLRP